MLELIKIEWFLPVHQVIWEILFFVFFCPAAYGIGLLITFVALAVMQMGQPALLYLVPCTLLTSLSVALWRRELPQFWTGSGFVVNTSLIWLPTAEGHKDFKKTTKENKWEKKQQI